MEQQEKLQVFVSLKHMGNVAKKVKAYPFLLERHPHTLGELVRESVKTCLEAYKARALAAETPTPLTDEQYAGMVEIGKLAFGVHYNENSMDPQAAMQAAMDAVADGLVRVFRGQEEFTGLDTPIELSQGDVLTFVRLTMLSGRLW